MLAWTFSPTMTWCLVVTDIHPFFADRAWLEDFGRVLVLYRDPIRLEYGVEKFAYITQYEDGLKIDFTLWPVEMVPRIVAAPQLPDDLDVGYTILMDKDDLTTGLQPPTYAAHIPSPPTREEYETRIEVFFHEATYVAKHLWRDDLMAAKYNLDYAMKMNKLRQMIEWRMEIDHDWSVKPGAYGRGLKRHLTPETLLELESTYVGAGEAGELGRFVQHHRPLPPGRDGGGPSPGIQLSPRTGPAGYGIPTEGTEPGSRRNVLSVTAALASLGTVR